MKRLDNDHSGGRDALMLLARCWSRNNLGSQHPSSCAARGDRKDHQHLMQLLKIICGRTDGRKPRAPITHRQKANPYPNFRSARARTARR